MEVKISKDKLMTGITTCMRTVPSKSTMPILECILMTVQDGEIILTSNDTEMGSEIFLEADTVSDGVVAVEAKTLSAIITKMPDGEITLKTDDENEMFIKCGRSKFNIAIRDGNEFPKLNMVSRENSIKVAQEILKDAIKETIFSASVNDTNKMMTGLLLSFSDILKVVALDGHRIAIREYTIGYDGEPVKLIVPSKALQELYKTLTDGDMEIFYTDSQVAFSFDGKLIESRLIDGEFFDIDRLMHYDFNTEIKVDRQELLACVDRATLLVKEIDRKPVVFTIGENLKAEITTQLGSMSEEIEIEASGNPLVIGLNPRFIIDIMRVLDDAKVSMYFVDSKTPCYIKGEGYIYVVLPIQLREGV